MRNKKALKEFAAVVIAVAGLMSVSSAEAVPIWDIVGTWTTNATKFKDALIYFFFLAGLGALGWSVMDMIKKSKDRGGDDVTWGKIGIKFLAGILLISITLTAGVGKDTVLNGVSSSNSF